MRADRLVAALLVLQSARQGDRGGARRGARGVREDCPPRPRGADDGRHPRLLAGGQARRLVARRRRPHRPQRAHCCRGATLFLLAGPSSHVAPQARSALRKLVQALPETFRAEAEAAASAIRLDPAKWGTTAWGPPPHLDVLQQAVIDGVQVRIAYIDRTRTASERAVHPLGLVEKGTVWYLIAGTESGMRTFRVGRIREVVLTDDPVERPPDFDLNTTWKSVAANIEELRTSFRARVLMDVRAVGAARPVRHGRDGARRATRRRSGGGGDRRLLGAPDRPAAGRLGQRHRGARARRRARRARPHRHRAPRRLPPLNGLVCGVMDRLDSSWPRHLSTGRSTTQCCSISTV
ncbi:MAG: WYL domain-containing protein [Ilumatobacteraceae bacterium]